MYTLLLDPTDACWVGAGGAGAVACGACGACVDIKSWLSLNRPESHRFSKFKEFEIKPVD